MGVLFCCRFRICSCPVQNCVCFSSAFSSSTPLAQPRFRSLPCVLLPESLRLFYFQCFSPGRFPSVLPGCSQLLLLPYEVPFLRSLFPCSKPFLWECQFFPFCVALPPSSRPLQQLFHFTLLPSNPDSCHLISKTIKENVFHLISQQHMVFGLTFHPADAAIILSL